MKGLIQILVDYKGYFGSKQKSSVYRSGMDLNLINNYFNSYGYETKIVNYSEIDFSKNDYKDLLFIYTSQEDVGHHYKSYIEDVLLGLELQGAILIPPFCFLKAHNNKVFMEIIRNKTNNYLINNIKYYHFGSFEELKNSEVKFEFPLVIKKYEGAMSKGVFLANSKNDLFKLAKKVSRSRHYFSELKDFFRPLKHKDYIKESKYRNKFIVQQFIPNLENDWKVLVYGNKCYVLYRGNRQNDFRASGSGNFIFRKKLPDGILDFASTIRKHFDVPHISLDIGFNGQEFHLIEFQFLYFGTTTLEKAPFYFEKNNGVWSIIEKSSELEKVYVHSIVNYINHKSL